MYNILLGGNAYWEMGINEIYWNMKTCTLITGFLKCYYRSAALYFQHNRNSKAVNAEIISKSKQLLGYSKGKKEAVRNSIISKLKKV